jgi:hypothetical protein
MALRLRPTGSGSVQITSEAAPSLALTTDLNAGNGSWVWLDSINQGRAQIWKLNTSDDGAAFLLETSDSHHWILAARPTRIGHLSFGKATGPLGNSGSSAGCL